MKKVCVSLIMLMVCMSMSAMKLSIHGKKFICDIEKCSLTRYWDNGAYSIGFGHRMPKGTKQYTKISYIKAFQLLNKDLRWAEDAANDIIDDLTWTPSQSFYDGLVSVIYNCGAGGIKKTNFYDRLMRCRSHNGKVNINDFNYTVAAIKTARIPSNENVRDGVMKRRMKEHKLMMRWI